MTPGTRVEIKRSHRFTRNERLLTAGAYGRVFDKATRSQDKWFTVLCRERQSAQARLGLAISKKNCRLAYRRNLIKRIIRESFRLNQHSMQGLDIVVINKPATTQATREQLFESLANHWSRCANKRRPDNG